MNIISETMTASKTFAKPGQRSCHWLTAAAGSFHRGTLTILQGKRDADSYQVDEDTSENLGPARRFLLAKLDAEGDVYAVTIGPRGNTCSGIFCGHAKNPSCKHRDAVLMLLAVGQLPPVCPECAGHVYTAGPDNRSAVPCVCQSSPAPLPAAAAAAA
jgi:hypothetical protein